MRIPTFLGIGAQKCASTWIYDILRDHPQVFVSDRKEIDFFSYGYDRGFQWYCNHFCTSHTTDAVGEISPSYFHEFSVPERVKRHIPDPKIIVSLRDPVERAISNHQHEVRVGHFIGKDLSFEAGLENNPMYLEQGLYAKHLARWFHYFSADKILVVFLEEIKENRVDVARRIYNFLNVNTDFNSEAFDRQSNPGHLNRYYNLERLRNRLHLTTKQLGLDSIWSTLSRLGLHAAYSRINKIPTDRIIPPISADTRVKLKEYFSSDVAMLAELLNREIPYSQ